MSPDNSSNRKAQLDKAEREALEIVVVDLRETVEEEIEYELEHHYGLTEREGGDELSASEQATREELVEAISLEGDDDHSWEWRYQQYISGMGYTIVNRLAAFRCMEVRGFLDRPVTQMGESGLTPASEQILNKRFELDRDEAIIAAYHEACEEMAAELEILFDPDSKYSVIDPDADLYRDLIELLDQVGEDIWRADDVLGWVYEYYNRPIVEELDAKNSLEPEDVGPANQFYTPHWVVRMLTDNSLGKLYLEATGQESSIPDPGALTPEERKERLVTPEDSPTVPELCTYLISDEGGQEAPSFDHPRELSVIDPACGSGHFLLYAFDILERIWWAETDDVDRGDIPSKILEHNLYGVDIDLRSCQLAAFNLYLKARSRSEVENDAKFEMPNLGIVCADASVAEVEEAVDVLDQITNEGTEVREALDEIIEEFQTTEALGSLLDVQGELEDEFESGQADVQAEWAGDGPITLNAFLKALREAVEERTSASFGEQNLRSFLNLLVVLTLDYDVALMNPPYGSGGRMPNSVQDYVDEHYKYIDEYYINFFEACDRFVSSNGRVGMLVPHSFMFNDSFKEFREDFIGSRGSFDFFAEFGYDILDNATVGTVGTVVNTGTEMGESGTFIRLPDVDKEEKEKVFLKTAFVEEVDNGVQRKYQRNLSEFDSIPGKNLSYWVPDDLRRLYQSETVLDADMGEVGKQTMGSVKVGLQTGNNQRFVRNFWEPENSTIWKPFAKGGADSWILSRMKLSVFWANSGAEIKRTSSSRPQNTKYYFSNSLTYTVAKRSGRRFGYLHQSSIFGVKGSVFIPSRGIWTALSYTNSNLFTYLMIAQTAERNWKRKQVARIPWNENLDKIDDLRILSREAVGYMISKRQYELISPHYSGPLLLSIVGEGETLSLHRDHPHRDLREDLEISEPEQTVSKSDSLSELGIAAARHLERIDAKLQLCADAIDETVFDCFDITENQRETILQEIALRTIEDPREREEYDPESITEPTDDFPELVKDLLLHLTLRTVNEEDDGVISLTSVEGKNDLLSEIQSEFERIFESHADDRLAEIDQLLGNKSSTTEAYPNLRDWLEEELFEYHLSKFDRTPILWKLTSERLTSNGDLEGFSCLIDYHQLDAGILDSLSAQYLDTRREGLRDRRNAADRRRNDQSLTVEEQSEATDEFHRYQNAIEQLDAFDQGLEALARTAELDRPKDMQETALDGADLVAEFREQTVTRLNLLDELAAMDDVDMQELFSNSFYETIQEEREEWIDALETLETAFEAYGDPNGEPVEAHLYDLFTYFDDVVGSSHFASNGILFMTWYFDDFEPADQQRLGELSEQERIQGELAQDLNEYKQLAEDISEACSTVKSEIADDWEDRALEEITADGYQPNHKHGVAINIAPFAEQDLVPEIVEDKVL